MSSEPVKRGFTKTPQEDNTVVDVSSTFAKNVRVSTAAAASSKEPAKLLDIPLGDLRVRSKLRFDVVTAKVIETAGKKHVVSKSVWRIGNQCHFSM